MWNLLIAAAVWIGIGLIISFLYRRQGHNLLVYAGLAWLGPILLLVIGSVAREQESPVDLIRSTEPQGDGWLDVLVGIDNSDESLESVLRVIDRLAPAIRRLQVVTSLDPETANSRDHFTTDEEMRVRLEQAAEILGRERTEIALITGRADRSLTRHAIDEDFDFIVISHRRHPLLSSILGSTSQRLTRTATVPVVVGPPVERGSEHIHLRSAATATGIGAGPNSEL